MQKDYMKYKRCLPIMYLYNYITSHNIMTYVLRNILNIAITITVTDLYYVFISTCVMKYITYG